MTETMKNIDPSQTPEQIIHSLLTEAAKTGEMQPMGQSIDFVQQQVSGLYEQLQKTLDGLSKMIGTLQVRADTSRLTSALVIRTLIKKGVFTKEEFDELYEEHVVKVMNEYVSKIQKEQSRLQEETKKMEEELKDTPEEETESDVVLASERQ